MTTLTQVTEHTGTCKRVPRDQKPVAELHLEDNQQVIALAWEEWPPRYSRSHDERKTSDWTWIATVVTACL